MQALLYFDIGAKTLSPTLTGSAFTWPKIPAGDDIRLKLRPRETIGSEKIASRRTITAMKMSVGRQDARPTSGAFQLKLGADAESAGVNTTAALGFDVSGEDFAAALNALTDAALSAKKPFTVTKRDGAWHVRAADGGSVTFSVADNSLLPQSIVSIRDYTFDEATHYEIRLIQTPVAEQTNWTTIVPELPSVTVVQHGAEESGVKRNTVQEIFFPPELGAGYSFRIKWGYRRTTPIVLPMTVAAIQAALDAIAEDGEEPVVTASVNRVVIEFQGDTLAGTDVTALEIESIVLPGADPVISLTTATDAMAKYMDSIANAATGLTEFKLPLSLILYLENEQDEEVIEPVTLITEITFQKPVSMAAFSNAATLNPTQPLSSTSYEQFSPTQITETQRGYLLDGATALGDGSSTEFVVSHNLGTTHVSVTLYDSEADGRMLVHNVDYTVNKVSDNATKITFAVAPGIGAVEGGIDTVSSTNAFVDLEINQGQVIDLIARLEAIEESLATLEANAAAGSVGTRDVAAGTTLMEIALPVFVDAYPSRKSITTQAASVADILTSELPTDGDILGAVHDAALTSLPGTFPTAASGNKGTVWQNRTAADVTVPGGGGRKSNTLRPGDCVASDGRRMFKVTNPSVDLARTFTAATDDTITLALHGYLATQRVRVFSTGTLPAGLSADTDYYVIATVATNTFKLSTSSGGSAVDITDTGTGTHYLHTAPLKTSWYPADFERVLLQEFVPGDALLVGRLAELKFGIEVGLRNKKTPTTQISDKLTTSRWRLLVEIGSASAEDAPATTDANLRGIVWQSTPVLDQTLYLNHNSAQRMTFGARVKRTAASTWTVEKALYGTWSASSATCAVSSFFLRARLVQFDTTDIPDAEGSVILMGLDKAISADSDVGKFAIK